MTFGLVLNLLSYLLFSVYLVVGADGEKVARFIRKLSTKTTVCIHYGRLLIYKEWFFLSCTINSNIHTIN